MKIFHIEENDAHQRLDKFLKKLLPFATRGLIYKLNRTNKIKVKSPSHTNIPENHDCPTLTQFKKKDNEYKLQIGDQVKIFLHDHQFQTLTTQPVTSPSLHKSGDVFDTNDIVFEDSDLLVINKKSGVNVHAGDHKTKETNVIIQVQDYLGGKLNSLTFKPSLIHRVDRDTSGILMIGKKKDMLTKLVADLRTHKKIKKTYYAIVLGKLSRKQGVITKKLLRIQDAKNENKVQVSEKGQTAITHYTLLKEHMVNFGEGGVIISEIEVEIKTGRMHQIRAHMASIHRPILGDKIYGDKKMNAYLKKNFGLQRQALHSWKIEFFHYRRNKTMKLEAKLKDDLIDFIKKIDISTY